MFVCVTDTSKLSLMCLLCIGFRLLFELGRELGGGLLADSDRDVLSRCMLNICGRDMAALLTGGASESQPTKFIKLVYMYK